MFPMIPGFSVNFNNMWNSLEFFWCSFHGASHFKSCGVWGRRDSIVQSRSHIVFFKDGVDISCINSCRKPTKKNNFWLVVSTCPAEKYEFVSWDDELPNWMKK